jgi:hypothetical protein
MSKTSKATKNKRKAFAFELPKGICRNCGKLGPHFAPPSLGEDGFYICKEIKAEQTASASNQNLSFAHS